MRHFLNHELLAPNVMTVPVAAEVACELLPLASAPRDKTEFCTATPPWRSDVSWVSPNTVEGYRKFESVFHRLGIAERVSDFLDLDREVRLYAGFLVIRSECAEADFHLDWENTNNEAFTLITPLTANTAEFGLIFRKLNGEIGEYDYELGEAIVFGDNFAHSTKPGRSDGPVVLLSFTFGTDKMEHWNKIFRTAGYQSKLVRQPDGEFVWLG